MNQQLVKGNCVYTVAVGTDTCGLQDDPVRQIPVSVHCSPEVQQVFNNMGHLEVEQINVPTPHYQTFNQLQPQFSQVIIIPIKLSIMPESEISGHIIVWYLFPNECLHR